MNYTFEIFRFYLFCFTRRALYRFFLLFCFVRFRCQLQCTAFIVSRASILESVTTFIVVCHRFFITNKLRYSGLDFIDINVICIEIVCCCYIMIFIFNCIQWFNSISNNWFPENEFFKRNQIDLIGFNFILKMQLMNFECIFYFVLPGEYTNEIWPMNGKKNVIPMK